MTEQFEIPGPLDFAQWRDVFPFEIRAWSDSIGVGSLTEQTLVDHLAKIADVLKSLSPGALDAWISNSELSLATDPRYSPGVPSRFKAALAKGSAHRFGQWLSTSPLRHDAQLAAWLAASLKTTQPNDKD